MITTFLQLNHGPTAIAPLPTGLFGRFKQFVRLFILRTVLATMPFAVTGTADLCLAATALPVLLPILLVDILRLDPFATSPSRAVNPILGRKLLKFLVPRLLEVYVK